MEPHQQRVVEEKVELDTKIERLTAFFDTNIYKGIDKDERERLQEQVVHMRAYSIVLGERIEAFQNLAVLR